MKTFDELKNDAYERDILSIENHIREAIRQGDTSTRVNIASLYADKMVEELKTNGLDVKYEPIRKLMTITWGDKF
jgi:hypothetical protein